MPGCRLHRYCLAVVWPGKPASLGQQVDRPGLGCSERTEAVGAPRGLARSAAQHFGVLRGLHSAALPTMLLPVCESHVADRGAAAQKRPASLSRPAPHWHWQWHGIRRPITQQTQKPYYYIPPSSSKFTIKIVLL